MNTGERALPRTHDPSGNMAPTASFSEAELEGLPEPVRRYFRASIAPGTALAPATRLHMRGSIKVGAWLPFRASQILAPLDGFVWAARVGGLLVGSDRYREGVGGMEWKLFGVRVLHAEGRDTSRSAAGRAGAEAMWVPTAMLPRFGVTWGATDRNNMSASYRIDDIDLVLHYAVDDEGRVRSIALERWAAADHTGPARYRRFVHEATRWGTFGGVTIPSAGRAGWFDGDETWKRAEFFRYRLTDLHLVSGSVGSGG